MSIWKRVITLVVVFMVLLSCLVSPASADATSSNIINLMSETDAYTFETVTGTNFGGFASYGFATALKSGNISWYPTDPTVIDVLYFTLEIGEYGSPSVSVNINGVSKSTELLGKDGRFRYYKCSLKGSAISLINISLSFPSSYTGVVTVISAFGTVDTAYSLNNASIYTQDLLFFVDSDELRRTAFENRVNMAFPITPFNHITNYVAEPVDPLLNGLVWIYNDADDMPFVMADEISYLITTCGSVGSEGFSFVLTNSSGDIIQTLPTEYIYSVSDSVNDYFGSGSMQWPLYTYSVSVDTSGIDLSGYNFGLNFWVDPVDIYYDDYTGWYCDVQAIVATPTILGEPWYARFGKWINSGFDRVVEAFGNSKSAQMMQAGQQLQRDAANINTANKSLDSVSHPDVDSSAMVSDFVDFNPVGLTVLSSITSNPMVTSMLVVVFTFCLAGYIFFGKKR